MKSKSGISLILASLLAGSVSANAQSANSDEYKNLETALIVLAQPQDRSEVKALLTIKRNQGLSELESARLIELAEKGFDKLKAAQPLMSSGY